MDNHRVVALHLKPETGRLVPVESLEAVEGKGFKGDRCFGEAKRQVLFVSTQYLEELGLEPGTLREQISVDLPGLQELPLGTIVRVGDVEFEITADCTPCVNMAKRLGEEPKQFIERSLKKRGMLANVRTSGTIRVGDPVLVAEARA